MTLYLCEYIKGRNANDLDLWKNWFPIARSEQYKISESISVFSTIQCSYWVNDTVHFCGNWSSDMQTQPEVVLLLLFLFQLVAQLCSFVCRGPVRNSTNSIRVNLLIIILAGCCYHTLSQNPPTSYTQSLDLWQAANFHAANCKTVSSASAEFFFSLDPPFPVIGKHCRFHQNVADKLSQLVRYYHVSFLHNVQQQWLKAYLSNDGREWNSGNDH